MVGNMTDELRPCPFCGKRGVLHGGDLNVIPVIDENGAYIDVEEFYIEPSYVKCSECGAETEIFEDDEEGDGCDKAIAAWNRRSNDEG